MLRAVRDQYHAEFKRTDFSNAFLDPQNLERLLSQINRELAPRTGATLAPDQSLVDELVQFVVRSTCESVPHTVEEANHRFASGLLGGLAADTVSENTHRHTIQDAKNSGRELFHQRQYRHDPVERPDESSLRRRHTSTSSYMLQHPYGNDQYNK